MTSNHILLYRLAELMLYHEQQVLPVDLLFDDEQIGDFVKSVQIDSPYQQMLLEGVLTEMVKEENLFVTFTVEGYFHYVLGEVIYNKTLVKEPEELKNIVEKNELNGVDEGVKNCLIRDVQNDELTRIIWLIDIGELILDICVVPLASSFLKIKEKTHEDKDREKLQQIQIYKVIDLLLKNPTDNDITVIEKSINYLELVQQNQTISVLYKCINEKLSPKSLKSTELIISSIEFIGNEYKVDHLIYIEKLVLDKKNHKADSAIFYRLARQFYLIGKFENAIQYFKKSLRLGRKGPIKKSIIYNDIGVILSEQNDYKSALKYYKKSTASIYSEGLELEALARNNSNISICYYYENRLKKSLQFAKQAYLFAGSIYGSFHPKMAIILSTLGNIFSKQGKYEDAINHFEDALKIQIKVFGEKHIDVYTTYNNLGNFYSEAKDFEKAKYFYKKSLNVGIECLGETHPFLATNYSNLGLQYENELSYQKAVDCHLRAYEINLKNNGQHHPETLESLFSISLCFFNLSNYSKSIENFELLLKKDLTSYIPATNIDYFDYIASAYEGIGKMDKVLDYHILSAKLKFENIGKDEDETIFSIRKCLNLSKSLNKYNELPTWIKKYDNDI